MGERNEDARLKERIAYWLDIAQYDLDTAEALLRAGRLLYVGFMSHQAIEKTLKACFVKNQGGVPPYSHNLRYLAEESGLYTQLSDNQKTLLETLEPLNIESRYPDYKKKIFESLTVDKCQSLIERTKEFNQWLRNRL